MGTTSAINIPPKEARRAAEHFRGIHGETPIFPLERIDKDGVILNIFGKLENVQSVFTFKARGAEWFVYNLMNQYHERSGMFRKDGTKPSLVTASAGNHAHSVAFSAKK